MMTLNGFIALKEHQCCCEHSDSLAQRLKLSFFCFCASVRDLVIQSATEVLKQNVCTAPQHMLQQELTLEFSVGGNSSRRIARIHFRRYSSS